MNNSILKPVHAELEIKKSRFIAHVYPISDIFEVENILKDLRNTYKEASHYCSAYIIGDNQETYRFDDDSEPSQTAGFPIFNVLMKHGLTNVLGVVIRYFGGTKLGAGGLVRAYTKSTAEALKDIVITYPKKKHTYEIIFPMAISGKLEAVIRKHAIVSEITYSKDVFVKASIDEDFHGVFISIIHETSGGLANLSLMSSFTIYE